LNQNPRGERRGLYLQKIQFNPSPGLKGLGVILGKEIDMANEEVRELEVTATYDQDSKRYHRYLVDPGQLVIGNLYVKKGDKPPESVKIRLRVKGAT